MNIFSINTVLTEIIFLCSCGVDRVWTKNYLYNTYLRLFIVLTFRMGKWTYQRGSCHSSYIINVFDMSKYIYYKLNVQKRNFVRNEVEIEALTMITQSLHVTTSTDYIHCTCCRFQFDFSLTRTKIWKSLSILYLDE